MRRFLTSTAVVLMIACFSTGASASCVEPGPTILTDPAGDATSGLPENDVLSFSLSQPSALGGNRFVFTLKMVGLATPPPNTTWPVIFTTPDFVQRFARMSTDPAGTVSFAHGLGSNPSPISVPGTPADPASSFNADGTIRIVVPGSEIGNPIPGQFITSFLTRIRAELGPPGALTPDNMPDDLVPTGSYEVLDCGPIGVDDASIYEVKDKYRVE